MTGVEQIDAMYRGEYTSESGITVLPPWEIGGPQPAMMRVLDAGHVRGRVLDVGCGTGELALYVAARGHEVVGVDGAPTAIERARRKAADRGAAVDFRVGDATELAGFADEFDTVLDVGLLHCIPPDDQPRYVAALRRVSRPGAAVHILCFSQAVGPDRLRELFGDGWDLGEPQPAAILGRVPEDPAYMQWANAEAGELAELPGLLVSAVGTA